MKWFLIWLVVTVSSEGIIDTRLYQTEIVGGEESCMSAARTMEAKLEAEGYDHYTILCESR